MKIFYSLGLLLLQLNLLFAQKTTEELYQARILKISPVTGKDEAILLLKVIFPNQKFLNVGNKIFLHHPLNEEHKACEGIIEERAPQELLLVVSKWKECLYLTSIRTDYLIPITSPDFAKNQEVVSTLYSKLENKARALEGLIERQTQELHRLIEEADAINLQYAQKKAELDNDWKRQLTELEEKRLRLFKEKIGLEKDKQEVHLNLEKYRAEDPKYSKQQWSLEKSSNFSYKK